MNKAQWKALYKFADEYGFYGGSEILNLLKVRGVIANNDLFDDLPRYAGTTYDDMYRFLADNLL